MNDEIVIYTSNDGSVKVDVRVEDENVWLTQEQICVLYGKSKSTISEHIRNIFKEEELQQEVVVRKNRTTTQHGAIQGKSQTHEVNCYNLDMIIAIGYRVKSSQGTQFRIWATQRLHEYIVKGFSMDDERLKKLGGGNYWKELLDRIRDIRSSEKVMYRQVLDIYATSIDYNPKCDLSIEFFKIVQNKLHYAAHGHTAAEIIFERADAEKDFMGLTNFKGTILVKEDVGNAKNYLTAEELKILNNIVSGYFDFAETQAMRHVPMYMKDYIKQLDLILSAAGNKLLEGKGKVSHQQAIEKALDEYRKYQVKTLSPVEQAYLDTIKLLAMEAKGKKEN